MTLKRILAFIGGLILTGMVLLIIRVYPFYQFFFTAETTEIDPRLTVMTAGGNSGLLVTDSAVVVIDTKMYKPGKKLRELAAAKAGNRKIIVINTHFHGDHTFGNDRYKGCEIYMGNYSREFLARNLKPDLMPTQYVRDSLILNLGDEIVGIYNLGQGHTFNDLVICLKNRKILFTGDLVFNRIHPALIREDGTDIDQWMTLLAGIPHRFDIRTVVPGHGDPGGLELITAQRHYFEDMLVAAANPEQEDQIKQKYAGWMKMPVMSSASRTIRFIRETGR